MRSVKSWCNCLHWFAYGIAAALFAWAPAFAETGFVEEYVHAPMPEGFRVEMNELEGPVFANADGLTIYSWPQNRQRNGYSGEPPGTPKCYDEVLTVTAGLMSPYPPGIQLPELDTRPSCTDLWPPLLADDDAKPVGKWSIVRRRDGARQWAYEEQPLYTSIRDSEPGHVLGGSKRRYGGDSPANRVPIGPAPRIPPGFAVKTTSNGRLLTTDKNYSVYIFEEDSATASACYGECTNHWKPVVAPELARAKGEWALFERSPGVRQWVFRGKPLYTYEFDQHSWSLQGSDIAGWQNVYTQVAPPHPTSFTVQQTIAGDVLADVRGMTIYTYVCGDDSADQLACDHPDDTQVYRLAMCGGGDPAKCREFWPYVEADEAATTINSAWRVISIDPGTGHQAVPEQEGAISVWAYRDRPVYTYGLDERPGDVKGAGTGEWRGQRNGLKAIWLRDDFMQGTL